jgi:hypothetical protein
MKQSRIWAVFILHIAANRVENCHNGTTLETRGNKGRRLERIITADGTNI